jgi:preprotein translocase SecE subunit
MDVAENKPSKKPAVTLRRKPESLREKREKALTKKQPRIKKVGLNTSKLKNTAGKLTNEYHPIKLGDSKASRFLTKKRSSLPGYIVNSVRELKMVEWPSLRYAFRLTFAVFAFSVVFAIIIRVLDFGFDKLFKDVILK